MSQRPKESLKPRVPDPDEEIDSFSLVGWNREDGEDGPRNGLEAPLLGVKLPEPEAASSPDEENKP